MAIQTMEKNSVLKYFEILKAKFFKVVILNSIFFTALTVLLICIMGLSSLFQNVFKIQSNVIDVLICLPFILLGPLTSAIIKVMRDFIREEPVFFWEDFKKAFKDNFKQSIVIALIQYIFVWAIYIAGVFYWNLSKTSMLGTVGLGVTIFVGLAFIFASYYFYMMIVTLKITIREIIKNSFIFTMLCLLKNVLLTIILAVWLAFVAWFTFMVIASQNAFLYGIAICLYMTLTFGLVFYTVAFFTFPSVKKYVLDPYYEEHPNESSKSIGKKGENGENEQDLPEFVYHNGKMVARSALENEKVFSDNENEE